MEETIEYKGHTIEIKHDDDPHESPRDWDNIGKIAYKHRNYKLGEEKIDDPIDWLADKLNIEDLEEEAEKIDREIGAPVVDVYSNQMLAHLENKFSEEFIALTLYLYDHSGISISTGSFIGRAQHARWDSGKVGYIYANNDTAKTQGWSQDWKDKYHAGETDEEIVLSLLESEIKTFDSYLRRDVYGWVVDDNDESCWGFIGDDEIPYMIEEAKGHIDYETKATITTHVSQLKKWIKGKVALIYRKPLELV